MLGNASWITIDLSKAARNQGLQVLSIVVTCLYWSIYMSLRSCKECGKQISTEAEICPGCGAKPPRRIGIVRSILLVFVALTTCNMVKLSLTKSETKPADTSAEIKQKTEKDAEYKRFAAALVTSQVVRAAARDPESVKFDKIIVNDDASKICAKYRAKNGFGGTNVETIVFVNGTETRADDSWLLHCTGKMHDQSILIN